MHKKPQVAAQTRMVDDGSGQVDVFRVEQNSLVPVEEGQRGKFYGGDCYIVFYTYMVGDFPNYIIYIWQGRHAGVDEITASYGFLYIWRWKGIFALLFALTPAFSGIWICFVHLDKS